MVFRLEKGSLQYSLIDGWLQQKINTWASIWTNGWTYRIVKHYNYWISAPINRSIYMKLLPRTNQFIKLEFCFRIETARSCANARGFFLSQLFLLYWLHCLFNKWKFPVHIQNMINGRCDCCMVKKRAPFTTSLILCLWSTVSMAAC